MGLYNVEIFTKDFAYRSSCQTDKIDWKMDYLAMDNSKIKLIDITAMEGDYVLITGDAGKMEGIVVDCEDKGTEWELQAKPLLSVTDVEVHFYRDRLQDMSMEAWLAEILNETYRDSPDELQNINGFEAVYLSDTYGAKVDTEENIGSLYEIIKEALVKYGITVDFILDANKKKLTASIQAKNHNTITLEADLPNILKKSFTFKHDRTANKVTVYNALNETEYMDFYLLEDGSITTDHMAAGRITPVIFKAVYVEHDVEKEQEETFAQKAEEKAASYMAEAVFNNLIELTVLGDDRLVNPKELEIGQRVRIIRENKAFETVLTGKIMGSTVKLIFGAVRMELTKILKRRI